MTAGERAGKAAAAAPDHRSRSAAADSHDAVEIFLALRIEDRDPIGEGVGQAGPYGDQTFGTQFCRDIGAGGAPRTISASGELSPALRWRSWYGNAGAMTQWRQKPSLKQAASSPGQAPRIRLSTFL
jgi:hypothetical protein